MTATFVAGKPIMADYTPAASYLAGDVIVVGGLACVAHADNPLFGTTVIKDALAIGGGIYSMAADAAYGDGVYVYWNSAAKQVTSTGAGNAPFGWIVGGPSGRLDDGGPTGAAGACYVHHMPIPTGASGSGTNEVATALNTVGAGTITAAGIAGGATTRGGAQAGAAFTDTTATAAQIIAALPGAAIGRSFEWVYQNNTNAVATLAGGAGVTISAITIVPANTWARFLVTYSAAGAVTIVGLAMGANASLPNTQFVTKATGNGTLALGDMEGAAFCALATSGATAFTTRTAAQIIANIPNAQIGMSYEVRVYNTNAGTLTLTGGTGVTIAGTATIATNVFRDYLVTITAAGAVTMQNIGSGVAN